MALANKKSPSLDNQTVQLWRDTANNYLVFKATTKPSEAVNADPPECLNGITYSAPRTAARSRRPLRALRLLLTHLRQLPGAGQRNGFPPWTHPRSAGDRGR